MNQVVEILMNRDGCTQEEAEQRLAECRALCEESLNYLEVEDIIASELGLEMDYIFDILG
jgi:hypothetical protein